MKKDNLTFLEAVKALEEGKCEEIENENGTVYRIENNILSYYDFNVVNAGIRLSPDSFLGKWSLHKVKPVKKMVIIENINWEDTINGITPRGAYSDWEVLPSKPKMKMTLEWEE